MQHGSETYFIKGEGLLGESLGGRELAIAATASPPFRFSRLGPHGTGRQLGDPARKALANAMAAAAAAARASRPASRTSASSSTTT